MGSGRVRSALYGRTEVLEETVDGERGGSCGYGLHPAWCVVCLARKATTPLESSSLFRICGPAKVTKQRIR